MFDIGSLEILLISVIGLFVVGPQRLPQTLRWCFYWSKAIKQGVSEVTAKVEKELQVDELSQELKQPFTGSKPAESRPRTPSIKPKKTRPVHAPKPSVQEDMTATAASTAPVTSPAAASPAAERSGS